MGQASKLESHGMATDRCVWSVGSRALGSMIEITRAERTFDPQREVVNDFWAIGFGKAWNNISGIRDA